MKTYRIVVAVLLAAAIGFFGYRASVTKELKGWEPAKAASSMR